MIWILVRQQDGPSKSTFRGLQGPSSSKTLFSGQKWPFWPPKWVAQIISNLLCAFSNRTWPFGTKKNNKITTPPKAIEYIPVFMERELVKLHTRWQKRSRALFTNWLYLCGQRGLTFPSQLTRKIPKIIHPFLITLFWNTLLQGVPVCFIYADYNFLYM